MSEQQFTEILSLLNKLDTDIRATNERLQATNDRLEQESKRFEAKFEKWDERYFQLVKDQGNTARTIIVAAASVVVLAPLLGVAADLIKHFFLN